MFIDSLQAKYFDCCASKFTILTRFRFITGLLKQIASAKTAAIPCEVNRDFQLHIGCFYSTIIHTNKRKSLSQGISRYHHTVPEGCNYDGYNRLSLPTRKG